MMRWPPTLGFAWIRSRAMSISPRTCGGRTASWSSAMRLRRRLGKAEIASDLVVRPRVFVRLRVGPLDVPHKLRIGEDVEGGFEPFRQTMLDPSLESLGSAVQKPQEIAPHPLEGRRFAQAAPHAHATVGEF